MLSRCVVIVDGGYARAAAAMVLGAGTGGGALIQNAEHLADTLRDVAEETTGQDLLRVYWYERAAYDADTALLQSAPYVSVRRDYAHSLGSQIAEDLSALLPHVQTGDLLFCTDDDTLRDIMHRTQQQGRHVHLVQVAGLRRAKPSALLIEVTDTWRWWPAETLAAAFRPVTQTSEVPGLPHAARPVAHSAEEGTASEGQEPVAHAYAAPESLYGAVEAVSHSSAESRSALSAADPTRLSANRQEQSEYLAARLRDSTASHAAHPKFVAAPLSDGPTPSRAGSAHQPFPPAYATGRTVTRFEPPRSSVRPESAGSSRADPARSGAEIPSELTARLRDIAEDIADEIDLPDSTTLRTWEYGIPAHIDRQLLGASHSTIGMLLDGAQKSLLRRFFREACLSRLTE